MVATIIMMVGLLALLQSVNIAIEHNMRNQQRTEVARIAEDVMRGMRSRPTGTVFLPYTTVPSPRLVNRSYAVRRRSTVAASYERYQVDVRWGYRNYSTTHSIASVRGR